MLKRAFDILVVFLTSVAWLPIGTVAAIAVFVSLGSPVFFRQKRPGLHGRVFTLYKFRTMAEATDGCGHSLPDAVRLTSVGRLLRRLSIDEIPQLWNVLKGDLSLVGPRPLLVEYLSRYDALQARRHDVKPGITGWAQVNGRNAISWEEKFALDCWYVDHQSCWLDIKIMWLTLLRVIRMEGINQVGHSTMPLFVGTTRPHGISELNR